MVGGGGWGIETVDLIVLVLERVQGWGWRVGIVTVDLIVHLQIYKF